MLRTVQLALEILTGLCATLPDPGPDADSHEVDEHQGECVFPLLGQGLRHGQI
jgi:hypothetical protein